MKLSFPILFSRVQPENYRGHWQFPRNQEKPAKAYVPPDGPVRHARSKATNEHVKHS